MQKKNRYYFLYSITLFLASFILIARPFYQNSYLSDFAAYCAISKALFEGNNPFPDHFEFLFCRTHGGEIVPIVYPGQMLLFVIPAYFWSGFTHFVYYALNIVMFFS